MCCFAGAVPIERVENTRIHVRRRGDRQLLVYEMKLATSEPVAMILPLHVARGGGAQTLRFIDLSAHAQFFDQLRMTFIEVQAGAGSAVPAASAALRVQQVGAFEASYVPGLADFARLDPRFRIDDSVWSQLGGYRYAGFAVFQLRVGDQRVHPMAFDYPARWPERLYFPTVHVHDGSLSTHATFDHELYFQGFSRVNIGGQVTLTDAEGERVGGIPRMYGRYSGRVAGTSVRGPLAAELVDLNARVFRLKLAGERPNDDTWVVPDTFEPSLAHTDRGASAWSPVE